MAKVPTLINLCLDVIRDQLYVDDDGLLLDVVYDLPSELFDCLLKRLPALALHNLQLQEPRARWKDDESEYDFSGGGRKRVRYGKFNLAWMALSRSRWPELFYQSKDTDVSTRNNTVEHESACDWRQKYWEMHLQKYDHEVKEDILQREQCFRVFVEPYMIYQFQVYFAMSQIAEALIKAICFERLKNARDLHEKYSQLYVHCQRFGSYARYLRLQNVLCTSETCQLLQNTKLQGLVVRGIYNHVQVDRLCRILEQNHGTLTSVELVNCKISFASIDAICDSLCMKGPQPQRMKHFSLQGIKLINGNLTSLPPKLALFLSSGRSLCGLSICDSHIEPECAKLIFKTLLDASSNLTALDFSENNISGWLSDFFSKSSYQPQFSSEISKSNSLQSLRVLKLRGNNLCKNDVVDLKSAIVHMPLLETLDLSDNPIGDEGIRSLIPYVSQTTEGSRLADLNLANCKLSCDGVTELLEALLLSNHSLTSLSIADNCLGSQVGAALGKFLGSSIESLDVRDIGLGSSGCLELKRGMGEVVNLVSINISENRGGLQIADFLLKLISLAPQLISVNAGYNLLPVESLPVLCSSLNKGKLQYLDLSGNQKLYRQDCISALAEYQHNGKPVVQIPTLSSSQVPYDDDP